MRQIPDRYGGDLVESVGPEYLDLVQAADRDIREGAVRIVGEIHVVRDRPGVDGLEKLERRLRIEDLRLADILEGEPHLPPVRRRRDVRAERARLLHPPDDLVIGNADDVGFRDEGRADVAVPPVGREDLHAGTIRQRDPRLLLICIAVEHRDIVLTTHRDPYFPSVRREEGLVRRAAHIGGVLDRIGRRIDESDGVRADRHDRKGPPVGRETHAVHQHLPFVERTEVRRLRLAEPDHAEELVRHRIRHRHGIRELLRGVDTIAVAQGNVGRGGGERRLTSERRPHAGQKGAGEQARHNAHLHGLLSLSSPPFSRCRRRAGRRREAP